jgi:hypothetical protein
MIASFSTFSLNSPHSLIKTTSHLPLLAAGLDGKGNKQVRVPKTKKERLKIPNRVSRQSDALEAVYGILNPGGTQYGERLGLKKTQLVLGGQTPANCQGS